MKRGLVVGSSHAILRVKADGGTLTHTGAALSWDMHRYYDLALDVGSLTLSP